MVSFADVLASNAQIPKSLPPGLVAVFTGATTGIGSYTLKTFVKYAVEPRIYFLARNTISARRVVDECLAINPKAHFEIIKADLSSVRETDRACDEVKAKEKAVNLLEMAAGEARLDRALSEEGLHYFLTTTYYTRIRVAQNLLPLLQTAGATSPLARVVDIAGGTKEGPVDTSDLPALKIPFSQIRGHLCSMHSLALEALAEQAPTVSFIQDFPGSVPSQLYDDIPGWLGYVIRLRFWVIKTLFGRWTCVPTEESGERHVYLGTSARYPPKEGDAIGVPISKNSREPLKGVDGGFNSGQYSVDWDCEGPGERVINVLDELKKKGVKELVWEHTNGEFERIISGTK
ncbi:hypothetical protein BDV96DRAFT_639582 [Lophiotrema nucula]|uniref:Uncharacterized protein n=1 Tax=Lophiotrema nucula TaxID=690887 RepID=A0A6A5ZTJ2_9PLEO|nr:hypothetical protein BDV96DRAFT_639582 [Lophiotrema nucula]